MCTHYGAFKNESIKAHVLPGFIKSNSRIKIAKRSEALKKSHFYPSVHKGLYGSSSLLILKRDGYYV